MQDKKSDDKTLLGILSEQLASAGESIIGKRKEFIRLLSDEAGKMYGYLTDDKDSLRIAYAPSVADGYYQELVNRLSSDLQSGTTGSGPHRDDIEWLLGDQAAKNYASQGEQRMIVLSVCMALCEYITKIKNDRPIFLLDDVFSELDASKQNRLIRYLADRGNQAIITATSILEIDETYKSQANLYHVFKGSIREEKHHGQP